MMFASVGLPPSSSSSSFFSSGFSLCSYGSPLPPPPPPPGIPGIVAMGACFSPLEPSSAAGAKKSPPSFAIADLLLLHAAASASASSASSPSVEAPNAEGLSSPPPSVLDPWLHFQAPPPPPLLRPRPRIMAPAPTEEQHQQQHQAPFGGQGPQGQPRASSPPPPPLSLSSSSSSSSSKDLKFGIDRILSAEFDPKLRENNNNHNHNTLRDLTSLLRAGRPPPGLSMPSPSSPFFASSLDPSSLGEAPGVLGPLSAAAAPRSSVQPHFQDTFPGPYAVLTKDTLPQTYKRKRSWSRAVFSNLQRKGLEKRFEIQKYVTKPDRKQLAAMLGLTDAQVKVWFQNRRMKWRHSKEAQAQKDKDKETPEKTELGGIVPAAAAETDPIPEGESESSESDSLELEAGSDAEGTETPDGANAEQALRLHSRESLHPGPETPLHPEPTLGGLPGPDPSRCPEPPFGLRDSP